MAQFLNSKVTYGWVAIFFHWLMAFLIIGMLALGLYMSSLPNGPDKLKLYGLHKEIGFLILLLVILRFLWMLTNAKPSLADLPIWEKWSAWIVHRFLYLLMFLMPLTGWLLTSAAGARISFFGWFLVPNIIPESHAGKVLFANIHQWLAYLLIALIGVHVLAALKHYFIDRDNILRRILFPID